MRDRLPGGLPLAKLPKILQKYFVLHFYYFVHFRVRRLFCFLLAAALLPPVLSLIFLWLGPTIHKNSMPTVSRGGRYIKLYNGRHCGTHFIFCFMFPSKVWFP